MTQVFEQQLMDVVSEYDERLAQGTGLDNAGIAELRTRCIAAVERVSGSNSPYYMNIVEFGKNEHRDWICLEKEMGIARALLSDMRNGYLQSVEELLHGNVFGDYLEMAMYLLDNDYKDAAAVLTGGTLEVHLKNMCSKHHISPSLTRHFEGRLLSMLYRAKISRRALHSGFFRPLRGQTIVFLMPPGAGSIPSAR